VNPLVVRWCLAALLWVSGPELCAAGGVISGKVYGGSGIVVPNVQVRITNSATGAAALITAAYSGRYELRDLAPGRYRVAVASMEGFPEVAAEVREGQTTVADLYIRPLQVSPDLAKPRALTMAALRETKSPGVSAVEVCDYVYGGYKGPVAPSPPHADLNPKKAVVVFWKAVPYWFVFSHEASYCPWIELPSGAAMAFQFFEGNEGWAELFNDWGRKERNSFVEIVEPGPERVWVRWTYTGVNLKAGEGAYRATEDFWAFPNGLILRRQVYQTLRPGDYRGYAREPVELMGMCPVGKLWFDVLRAGRGPSESHALAVLDAYSTRRYDVYWKRRPGGLWEATARREGAPWRELDDARGVALVTPMTDGSPFCVFGDASGYRHDYTRIKEHSHADTGGVGWISQSWDHWPIGWLNSQGHVVDRKSLREYPNSFSPAGMDFFALPNEESERGIYYSLIGVADRDLESVRRVARRWLDLGPRGVGKPAAVAGLPRLALPPRGNVAAASPPALR